MSDNYTNVRPQMDEQKLEELAAAMQADGRDRLCVRKVKLGVKSLAFLEHFGHLKALFLEEVKTGLAALRFLDHLEELTLNRMRDLKCAELQGVPQLRKLYIGFSSLSKSEGLETLAHLEELRLHTVSGLENIEFLSQLTKLRSLDITDCNGITAFPNLANLTELTWIDIGGLSDVNNIDGVFTAPHLKKLAIGRLPKIEPEALEPALHHPTLEVIYPGLVDVKGAAKNQRAAELLEPRFGDVFDVERLND